MCPRGCVAYNGPFSKLKACPDAKCSQSHWDPNILKSSNGGRKVPAQTFLTIPIGPQIQALWHTPKSMLAMSY
ncbi:hypothetical protein K439DRAFT_1363862 [Ramaria rubella]|nr:hypothetical protein K439DRAFT_1363862 [Ramaria rubella]